MIFSRAACLTTCGDDLVSPYRAVDDLCSMADRGELLPCGLLGRVHEGHHLFQHRISRKCSEIALSSAHSATTRDGGKSHLSDRSHECRRTHRGAAVRDQRDKTAAKRPAHLRRAWAQLQCGCDDDIRSSIVENADYVCPCR